MSRRQASADEFASYQRRAMAAARAVFDQQPRHATDEQGGPMYLQAFAVSRWIFWKRLAITYRLLARTGDGLRRFRLWIRIALAVSVTPL